MQANTNPFARMALLNFVVLGLWGVLLRYLQTHAVPGLNAQFLLHGHSHFAFSGWMFLALAVLMADSLQPAGTDGRFRTVFRLTQVCSLGMLLTFSLQGYKAAPLIFSTLFVIVTYRFSHLVLRNPGFRIRLNPVARHLFGAALVCLCISSLGPFALGPLMVNGLKGSAWYQNSIYFYLHFQMNGWMVLGALGVFAARHLDGFRMEKADRCWLRVLTWSTLPLYAMFTLWSAPGWLPASLAAGGAALQLVAWTRLCLACRRLPLKLTPLVRAALLAISLKSILQLLICFPPLGDWVFMNRNLIIGYVHLITLASVTPLILDQFRERGLLPATRPSGLPDAIYLLSTAAYLGLLFLQPLLSLGGIHISHFHTCLLLVSILLVAAGAGYCLVTFGQAKGLPVTGSPADPSPAAGKRAFVINVPAGSDAGHLSGDN